MKLYKTFLFIIVVAALVGGTAGCVLEDFSEQSGASVDGDAGSSDDSGSSCVPDADTCSEQAGPGANGKCINGTCQYQCQSVYADDDDDVSNGCEIDLRTVDNCGSVGNKCRPNSTNRLPVCTKNNEGDYMCGFSNTECVSGFKFGEDEGDGCVPG
jgi:hypothetical protein